MKPYIRCTSTERVIQETNTKTREKNRHGGSGSDTTQKTTLRQTTVEILFHIFIGVFDTVAALGSTGPKRIVMIAGALTAFAAVAMYPSDSGRLADYLRV